MLGCIVTLIVGSIVVKDVVIPELRGSKPAPTLQDSLWAMSKIPEEIRRKA